MDGPRNVVITGGNSGIGWEMALALAGLGHRVVIASRDERKLQNAVERIEAQHPGARIEALRLDLADFGDIDRFAAEVLAKMPLLDTLMLNAGLYTMKPRKLPNGLEAMIGVMHFGHFRLARYLLDAVKAAPQGRIVVTSSMMHKYGRIDEASFTDPSRHRSMAAAYGQAKLANLLFTRELARRLAGARATVNAFHPGPVATGIYRELPRLVRPFVTAFMLTPAKGADTGIWLATAKELAGVSGEYFVKRKQQPGSPQSRDTELARRLWQISEQAM